MSAATAENPITRPALRWHGGKFRLAPWIQNFFPPHRIYCEPYCGAASVLLTKPRCWAEYLNDLDAELINLFRVLQDGARANELRGGVERGQSQSSAYQASPGRRWRGQP
jgi:DNA adenine methylase